MKHALPISTLAVFCASTLSRPALAEYRPKVPASPDTALAHDSQKAGVSDDPPFGDISGRLGLGGGTNAAMDAALSMALTFTARASLFAGGIELGADSELFGGSYTSLDMLAGIGVRDSSGLRFELFASGGRGAWQGIGCGMFCESGGAETSLPHIGARTSVSYAFSPRRRGHFVLGLAAYRDQHLGSKDVRYQTTSDSWFGPGTTTSEGVQRFAGHRTGMLVTLGGMADI